MELAKRATAAPVCTVYTDGSYLAATSATWHEEDAPFKAAQVLRMMRRDNPPLHFGSICDIGCGTGGVMRALERELAPDVRLVGYEVSPQAHELSQKSSSRAEFVLADPFTDGRVFDVALVLDVVEHVEDHFGFMRLCRDKARWKIYHIPLDVSASTVLRGSNCWASVGHLHLFTRETALKSVEHSGQQVIDWFMTPVALQRPHRPLTRLTNLPRKILPEWLASRVFGGYSMMILAR